MNSAAAPAAIIPRPLAQNYWCDFPAYRERRGSAIGPADSWKEVTAKTNAFNFRLPQVALVDLQKKIIVTSRDSLFKDKKKQIRQRRQKFE